MELNMLRSIISNTEKKENLIITILKFNEERILSTLTSLLEEMEWDEPENSDLTLMLKDKRFEKYLLMLDKSYECNKTEISIIKNIKYESIKKQDLIDSIYIGYNKKLLDMKNDEEGIDEEPENTNLPINCNESQYAYEFGFMMAREGMQIRESDMDEYLEGILIDSNSEFTIDNLK